MKSSILLVLAAGFAGFGALEVAALGPGAGGGAPADAASVPDMDSAHSPEDETKTPPLSEPEDIAAARDAACLTPALVAAFEPRDVSLREREARLERRAAELAGMETALEARLSDMETAREALAAMTARIDVAAGEDITHLVDMYSTMKPKKAAAIFDRMDPAFAAGFLREIDSARAGVIMAEMGEEQSYRVSLLIANRHAEWRGRG
ncbi:MAG: hypothetical protein AAF311_07955 [Pseudomonadota bacterium]